MVSTPSAPAPRRHLTITPASVILVCVATLVAIAVFLTASALHLPRWQPTQEQVQQVEQSFGH